MPTVIANFLMSCKLFDEFHTSCLSVKDVFILGVNLVPRFSKVFGCIVFDMDTRNTVFLFIIKTDFLRFSEFNVFLILNILH